MILNYLINASGIIRRMSLLILAVLFSASCNHTARNAPKEITVSILPQKYIVERIAGNLYNVNVMMPPGANHETYEPTPLSMKALANSEIYFSVGWLDFERTWTSRFADLFPGMKIVNTSEGGKLLAYEGHGHVGHDTGIDPHTWLSPGYIKFQAAKIATALSQTDPEHAAFFRANLHKFSMQLDSINTSYIKRFAPLSGTKFLIYHPALGYFARDYNLRQISLEIEGKEPSATHLTNLIQIARSEQIHAILVSKEFDSRNAETLAGEINGKVVVFDPMAADLLKNLDLIADILSHRQN
jgi:zinc transport system substrate-binding protein